MHQEVIVALHPPGPFCATHGAIESEIERTLQSHLGADRWRLRVRWGVDWHPGDEEANAAPGVRGYRHKERHADVLERLWQCGGWYTYCGTKRTDAH